MTVLGMSRAELEANPVATEPVVVKDLNYRPDLPFEDNSFDIVTNVVSVDYLTKPLNSVIERRQHQKIFLRTSICILKDWVGWH